MVPILSKVQPSGAHLSTRFAQVGHMRSMLGTSCVHVEPMLGICWPMLAYVGLGRDYVGHMLAYGVCWPYVGIC